MVDEKDRLGDKLKQSEKALEDQWARQQDAELMEKMRQKKASSVSGMNCPKCGENMVETVADGIRMLACPNEDGAWLDRATLESLIKK